MKTHSSSKRFLVLVALVVLSLQWQLHADEKPSSAVQERRLTKEEDKLLGEAEQADERGFLFWKQGKHADAEREARSALTIRQRILGPEHFKTLESRNSLAAGLQSQGNNAGAEKEHRVVLAIRERVLGAEHPDTLWSRDELAIALLLQGKGDEAEKQFREALAIRRRILDAEDGGILGGRYGLARALHVQGKNLEAEQELRPLLAILEQVRDGEYDLVYEACYYLALCCESQGNLQDALRFAKRAEAGYKKSVAATHPKLKDAEQISDRIGAALKKQPLGGK
jgi:tetratricopeptide (TPR) repeat protein